MNNHSGNEAIVEETARAFKVEAGMRLANVLLLPIMQSVVEDLYPDLAKAHRHDGELGVSAQLFLCPEDMGLDLAAQSESRTYHGLKVSGTTLQQGVARRLYPDFGDTNPSGGSGDARDADAGRGKTIMDRPVACGIDIVEAFRKIPTRTAVRNLTHRPTATR